MNIVGFTMRTLYIYRIEENEYGTFGILTIGKIIEKPKPYIANTVIGWVLELPWRNNEKNISRIPAQHYGCRREDHPRFGDTLRLQRVPNRSGILFHSGNTVLDTEGCIMPGLTRTRTDIRQSRLAQEKLMNSLGEDRIATLVIYDDLLNAPNA